jgi:hypothetical protein
MKMIMDEVIAEALRRVDARIECLRRTRAELLALSLDVLQPGWDAPMTTTLAALAPAPARPVRAKRATIREKPAATEGPERWRLMSALREVINGMDVQGTFSSKELQATLVKRCPKQERAIDWGLSNALRRLASQGVIQLVGTDGRTRIWRKQADAHTRNREMHEEIRWEMAEAKKEAKD